MSTTEKVLYPSWRYAATGATCIVHTSDEDAALGPGWYQNPGDIPEAERPKPAPKKGKAKGHA